MQAKVFFVYILKCKDNSYYTGVTSDLLKRIEEHKQGLHKGSYTYGRRPVTLVYFCEFTDPAVAIATEKRIKKWSRAKKEALINGEYGKLPNLSKKRFK